MLYYLSPFFQETAGLNLFRYITFRSFVAFMISLIISIIFGKYFIRYMKSKQFGQVIREDGPKAHLQKAGTPTMGGILIIGSMMASLIVAGNFASTPFVLIIGVMLSFFILGWLDDYLKVIKKNSDGISAKGKLLWQTITSLIAGYFLISQGIIDTQLYLPFVKGPILDGGYYYLSFIVLVIVGSSNAVNLTDGLDGLAIGPIITSVLSLGVVAYVTGHSSLSTYLFIPYIKGAGELSVFAASMVGAGVGFLWYNSYPAQIFMGDAGSLSLGGALGTMAVLVKSEFLFAIIGGLFVVEALSVILQVGSFKIRNKRIFRMAPIHHHSELKGWAEPKVIVRFWIISLFLALLGIASLKIR